MSTMQSQSEKTSSEKKAIGFEYQYWFFLWRVLQLKSNQSVGLEVADDVHTTLENDRQILFQLKHTLKKRSDGTPNRLTTYDRDLWKTMSNWSKIISDRVAGRQDVASQLCFIDKTDFILVTNKSEPIDSAIHDLLAEPTSAAETIRKLRKDTNDRTIQSWMDDVLSLQHKATEQFISKIILELDTDELIQRCKSALLDIHIPPECIDQLLRNLDSQIRQDNFLAVKAGAKIVITFEDYRRRYRRFYDQARSTKLQINREYQQLPDSLLTQTFIQQLLDIKDVRPENVDEIVAFTRQKQCVERNLLHWELEGQLTGLDREAFDRESTVYWQNANRTASRSATDEITSAVNCLDELRRIDLRIDEQHMGIEFSNGQFYRLADIPKIGFLRNWLQLYGKRGP